MFSYTGDGAGGTRVIARTPVSNRFPLFALIIPRSGGEVGYFRDPSHVGADSSTYDVSAISTTAIVAGGIDTISVGTTLNALGIIYDVFVIPGDTAGWNNGTFFVPSIGAPGGTAVWPLPAYDPSDVGIIGAGGLILDGAPGTLLVKDLSGIYTIQPGKTDDTVYDRQTGQTSVDFKIPDPLVKLGFVP